MSQKISKTQILGLLKRGCFLAYFFIDGGVGIENRNGEPIRGKFCPIDTFLELRDKGSIEFVRRRDTGYPHYANNTKYSIYKISAKGLVKPPKPTTKS